MTTAHYSGLNRFSGGSISDMAHIRQSCISILTTPKGTRLMQRDYGSDLPALVDGTLTPSVRLKAMSAAFSALSKWEPRLALSSVTASVTEGRIVLTISGIRRDTRQSVTFSTDSQDDVA